MRSRPPVVAVALAMTAAVFSGVLAGCHSSASKDAASVSKDTTSSTEAGPTQRHTRQFIPELGLYLSLPPDWVAFADGVHDNKGMATFQIRPKWETPEFAQYVRIRKLVPTPDLPQVQDWLKASNADAVNEYVQGQKAKAVSDKRDSWDGPSLPGASATIEFEKPPASGQTPPPAVARKIYVAFVGQGEQRWQVATTNSTGPNDQPSDQFLGEQADAIARSIQILK